MNGKRRFGALLLLGVSFLWLPGCAAGSRVVISREQQPILERFVTFATTPDERRRGLQGGEELGPDEALVLVFPGESEVCIHNTGVAFSIDVLFVREGASGATVTAIETAIPAGDETLRCHRALWAVELRSAGAQSVRVGDQVTFDVCD